MKCVAWCFPSVSWSWCVSIASLSTTVAYMGRYFETDSLRPFEIGGSISGTTATDGYRRRDFHLFHNAP